MKRGVSLLSIVLLIAIIAISSFIAVAFIFFQREASLETQTKTELEAIYKAIIGDGETHFGYHGDLGVIPPQLRDLIVQGNQLSYPTGIGPNGTEQYVGWKGPYYNPPRWDGTNILDPYGNPYINDINTSTNTWQIRSAGPNGVDDGGSGDDIVVKAPITVQFSGGYAYIPSRVKFSFNIGKFTGIQSSVHPAIFRIYLPLYNTTTYMDIISDTGEISGIPVGSRLVLPAFYEKIDYINNGQCFFYYFPDYFGTNGTIIVPFPFEKEGTLPVNWPSSTEILMDYSYCRRTGRNYRVYIYVRSSLTWAYPTCTASQEGIVLKITGEGEEYTPLRFNRTQGYFYERFVYRRWQPPPYTYIVTSNTGASLEINLTSCY